MEGHPYFTAFVAVILITASLSFLVAEHSGIEDTPEMESVKGEAVFFASDRGSIEETDEMGGEWWEEVARSGPGTVFSPQITVPPGMIWDDVHVAKTESPGVHVLVSVLDEAINSTIPGFDNRSETTFAISNVTTNTIRLMAILSHPGGGVVRLVRWGVEWKRTNTWRDGFVGDDSIDFSDNISTGAGESIPAYWRFSSPVIIENEAGMLNDFQVALELNTSNFNYSAAGPNGEDLRFIDEIGMELDHWIEGWNALGDSRIWIRTGTIPNGTSKIEMLYGNSLVEDKGCGEDVFLFFDDFEGGLVNESKWWVEDSEHWSVAYGTLKCTGNNGRLRSKGRYTSPVLQEARVKVITRAPNGVSVCGFYSANNDCFGLLSHSETDWVRNEGVWTPLGDEFMAPHIWYDVGVSATSDSTVNLRMVNVQTGAMVHEREFQNEMEQENVTLGRRYDDWKPGQGCEVYWESVRIRRYASDEPRAVPGEARASPEPKVISVPVELPRMCLWSNLEVIKDEPKGTSISVSVLDAATNEPIPGFENITNSLVDLSGLNELDVEDVRLTATFGSRGRNIPFLLSWGLNWSVIEPPLLLRTIPDIDVDEDEPAEDILNVSGYFKDIYSMRKASMYSMEYVPDPVNISMEMNGSGIAVRELRENWTGRIRIRVKCTNAYGLSSWSNFFHINVVNVNDHPVAELIFPEDGYIHDSNRIVLMWNSTDIDNKADEIRYDLYFGDSSAPYRFRSNITERSFTMTELENGMTCYWYVLPRDNVSAGTCESGIRRFTVNIAELELISPNNGSILNDTSVNLTWAFRYGNTIEGMFRVLVGPSPDNLSLRHTTRVSYYDLELPGDNGTYWWKIMAEYDGGIRRVESEVRYLKSLRVPPPGHGVEVYTIPERIIVSKGEMARATIIITNCGDTPEEVSIEVLGTLADSVEYDGTLPLGVGQNGSVYLKINTNETEPGNTYFLTVRAHFSGQTVDGILEVRITPEEENATANEEWSIPLTVLAVGGTLAVLLVVVLIAISIRKKKRRPEQKEEALDVGTDETDGRFRFGDVHSSFTPRTPAATAPNSHGVQGVYHTVDGATLPEEGKGEEFDATGMEMAGYNLDEPKYGYKGGTDGRVEKSSQSRPPETYMASVSAEQYGNSRESGDFLQEPVHPEPSGSELADDAHPTLKSAYTDVSSAPAEKELLITTKYPARTESPDADVLPSAYRESIIDMEEGTVRVTDAPRKKTDSETPDIFPSMDTGDPAPRELDEKDVDVSSPGEDGNVLDSFSTFLNRLPEKFSNKMDK